MEIEVVLLDSSALLAYLWDEPGSEVVQDALLGGQAQCTVVNWAEVAQKILARQGDWPATESALIGLGLTFTVPDAQDAVAAARLWVTHPSLSLADRLCLAMGIRRGASMLTADQAWAAASELVIVIRPSAGTE